MNQQETQTATHVDQELQHDCKTIEFICNQHKNKGQQDKSFIFISGDGLNNCTAHLLQGKASTISTSITVIMQRDQRAMQVVMKAVEMYLTSKKKDE